MRPDRDTLIRKLKGFTELVQTGDPLIKTKAFRKEATLALHYSEEVLQPGEKNNYQELVKFLTDGQPRPKEKI